MTPINDGLVDSPFGRVTPAVLDILNGGQGSPSAQPAPTNEAAPVAAPAVLTPEQEVAARYAQPVEPTGVLAPKVVPADEANSLSAAVGRGVDNLQASGGGTLEAIGQATGSQYLTDLGSSIRDSNLEQAKAYGTPEYQSVDEITDPFDMDQVGQYLKNQVGAVAPQLAIIGGAGAALSKAPGVAGLIGKTASAALGSFAASFGINTGAIQNELKVLDPQGQHPLTALSFGATAGVLDAVGFGYIAKGLMKYTNPETIYMHALASGIPAKTALEGLKSAAKGAVVGGGIGAATDVAQGIVAGEATDKPYSAEQLWTRAIDAGIGGAMGGGALRAGGEILDSVVQHSIMPGSAVSPSKLKSGDPKEHGILNKIWDQTSGEATRPLEPLTRVSPEFDSLVQDFRPDMTGKRATGETVHERYEINSGTLHTKFSEIIRGMSKDKEMDFYRDISKPVPQTPEGKAYRAQVGDEIYNQAINAGLQVGRIEGHMPLTPDDVRIRNQRAEFEADIAPYVKDTAKATDEYLFNIDNPKDTDAVPKLEQLVQPNMTSQQLQIMARFTKGGNPDTLRNKVAQGSVPPKNSNLEFTRAFNEVPQEVMNKWVKEQTPKEIRESINDYIHGAAHRIAFSEKFGGSGELLNARIAKGVYEAQQKGYNPSKAEISQMYGVADAYNGMYGRIKSADVRNASAIAGTVMNIKTLPFAALMSLTELGTPMLRFNVMDTLASVAPALREMGQGVLAAGFNKVPRSEWSKLSGEAGVDWKSTQNLVGERLGATAFNRTASKANRLYFLANGLSVLTHAQRTLGALTGKRVYKNNLQLLAAGLDMTSARGQKAQYELRSLGVNVKTQAEANALYSPKTASERAHAREVERLMVRRAATQSILEPTSSDMPLWMSSGYAAPLAQLKRYPTAYTNIILPQLLRRNKPSYQGSYTGATAAAMGTAFTIGLMFYLGLTQDYLSRYAKAGMEEPEDDRTEGQINFDVVNRTFTPMGMQYLTNMYGSDRYGQGPVESQLGPLVGSLNDAFKASRATINSFEDDPTSGHIWKFLYKQTPFGSIKPGQEAVKEAFDLP